MLIREAADPTLTGRQRGKLVRALAAMTHTDPQGRSIRISRWTLDRWISEWQRAGFDALVPSPRQSQPRTPAEVLELASALKKENPGRSAAQIRRILSAQHGWAPDERTLQRMFVRTGLNRVATGEPVTPGVFGRFEAERPNEIWTGDALHGPRVDGRKTYLFAFIDDHPGRWSGIGGGSLRTPSGWPPRCGRPSRHAAFPSTSTSITGPRSWIPGCCAPARSWASSWCTPHPAGRRAAGRSRGSCAPRGAWLYPRRSREELEGRFLGLMAYLDPKGEGDKSMPGNQWPGPDVRDGVLGDPRDMAKAGLPEPQSPEEASS